MDSWKREIAPLFRKRPCESDQDERRPPSAKRDSPSPKDFFPFMKLPGELRNLIYEYVADEVPSTKERYPIWRHEFDSSERPRGIDLTQVSRQVRFEFRPLWFDNAKFLYDLDFPDQFMDNFIFWPIEPPTPGFPWDSL
ncbi:hypothetical protein BDW02DRAFT_645198 [Decorospora gaudefroyi]|uniref:F-box domain-containing protein n=1 Tax=Decorospora gaudefroyi TaxID=184978 RepID=A0A6A5KT65_9PLEO|nr:hypothetical protein BDW02DRAFT_645198 [Decorospora gaudefroyi]